MKTLLGAVLVLLLAITLPVTPAPAQDAAPAASTAPSPIPPEQKEAFEKLIHSYLIEHPEVIKEAILALQAREEADKADAQAQAVTLHKDELLSDAKTPIAGNPMGDVTIVEFFDYHCPYCKAVAGPLDQLLQDDKGIRLVLKEFPILGDDSRLASRAALAAVQQGKYWDYHQALMAHRGPFDMDVLTRLATKAGLDAAKLQADMAEDKTMPLLEANRKLADALDLSATPTFVIDGQVIEGAVPLERLKELVKRARGS
jgi:protein-disulfide isomerase